MTPGKWLALGLGIYALGLLAGAPATLIDAVLQHSGDGRLRLAEARGTLWSGSGVLEIRSADGSLGIGKALAWRFLPGSILSGRLLCEVALEQDGRFAVALTPARIELADAAVSLPAAALGLALPQLAPLGPGGAVRLHVEHLTIEHGAIQGRATLHWRDAVSALAPGVPLGDYELRLESGSGGTRVALDTLQGALRLDGAGAWKNGARPQLLATARVAPERYPQLAPLLRLIAVERHDGGFDLPFR